MKPGRNASYNNTILITAGLINETFPPRVESNNLFWIPNNKRIIHREAKTVCLWLVRGSLTNRERNTISHKYTNGEFYFLLSISRFTCKGRAHQKVLYPNLSGHFAGGFGEKTKDRDLKYATTIKFRLPYSWWWFKIAVFTGEIYVHLSSHYPLTIPT